MIICDSNGILLLDMHRLRSYMYRQLRGPYYHVNKFLGSNISLVTCALHNQLQYAKSQEVYTCIYCMERICRNCSYSNLKYIRFCNLWPIMDIEQDWRALTTKSSLPLLSRGRGRRFQWRRFRLFIPIGVSATTEKFDTLQQEESLRWQKRVLQFVANIWSLLMHSKNLTNPMHAGKT